MVIKKLFFSKNNLFEDFQNWTRENNKKSLLYVQSIYTIGKINDMLRTHRQVPSAKNDMMSFVSDDSKIRVTYEKIRKPGYDSYSYVLVSYHNARTNTVYLLPEITEINAIYWLQLYMSD